MTPTDPIALAEAQLAACIEGVPDHCVISCDEPEGTLGWPMDVRRLRLILAALREARAEVERLRERLERIVALENRTR